MEYFKIVLEIAGIGVVVMILDKVFDSSGRKEQGTMITLLGIVVVFMMVLGLIGKLFGSIRTIFMF